MEYGEGMAIRDRVLISWVAVNNDPYERESGKSDYRILDGQCVPGPTLTLLFDDDSPYRENISDVVLLYREIDKDEENRERRSLNETVSVLNQRKPDLNIHKVPWSGDDPTDHLGIFDFLKKTLPRLRKEYRDRELLIHISPGTPSMQTVWVLMAETGFVDLPFQLVKSYRKSERRGRPAVVSVNIDIDTFYKAYKKSQPKQCGSEDQGVVWDPGHFKTEIMKRLFAEARRFAHLNIPVLILGERGTGKTTLASWMRLNSPFRVASKDQHWPAVACGQYTPEMMRAELFGYRKGAFTGAARDYDGVLKDADKDTLFLDEIGDVSRDLQRLLIKAIEEKKYIPLGGDGPLKSDFRLLSATNIEMHELEKRLDPDFLDRISMMTLRLPALREIPDEIPWLWDVVFDQAQRRSGCDVKDPVIPKEVHGQIVSALMKHTLPGNLRDLFRVAYRVLAAVNDPDDPVNNGDVADYGLVCLDGIAHSSGIARQVAGAFSHSNSLDSVVQNHGSVPTKTIQKELNAYLAGEIRRLSKKMNRPINELCDVGERTLRSWVSENRKDVSGTMEKKFRKSDN